MPRSPTVRDPTQPGAVESAGRLGILAAGHNSQVTGCWIGYCNGLPLAIHREPCRLSPWDAFPRPLALPTDARLTSTLPPVGRIRRPRIQREGGLTTYAVSLRGKCWSVTWYRAVSGMLSAVVRETALVSRSWGFPSLELHFPPFLTFLLVVERCLLPSFRCSGLSCCFVFLRRCVLNALYDPSRRIELSFTICARPSVLL